MLKAFFNIWKIPELRNKLLFTIAMLVIYRIGAFIPLLGMDQKAISDWAANQEGTGVGNLLAYVSIFTGGELGQSTIFGLGIMPYISAAIIFQLLGSVLEPLKQLKKEGPAGQQKITEYTRYATVALCVVQGAFWMKFSIDRGNVYPAYTEGLGALLFWTCGVAALTAGSTFLMWLGEQIDKYGLGNGISLIITAGIISSIPGAIGTIAAGFDIRGGGEYGIGTVIWLLAAFIAVTAGAILITQGQRRIPIQQAKQTRGARVFGGQKSYLPLRVNHGGVMPIIFASSLMIFPSLIFNWMASPAFQPDDGSNFIANAYWAVATFLQDEFADLTGVLYALVYIGLIYFFAYFWTTVQFQPKEMANQLRDYGSFIPGVRPGKRTADYLERIMMRITFVGAAFLAAIAVIPMVIATRFNIPFEVSAFLGGTGLLIVVSVALDMVQRIEANLVMRNYSGFLAKSPTTRTTGSRGKRIRGSRQ